jgi:hypothetical protein
MGVFGFYFFLRTQQDPIKSTQFRQEGYRRHILKRWTVRKNQRGHYMKEYYVDCYLREAKAFPFGAETSEAQKLSIAASL